MRFSIAGYYGFGNVGDDAILESMLADFRSRFPGASFEIIGAEYWQTASGPDVTFVPWTDWPRVLESLDRCDWLIVGGGGLFNSYLNYSKADYLRASSNFAAFVFGLPVAAYILGRRSFIYAVGASRFLSTAALTHARMAVRFADGCTLRDKPSRSIICESRLEAFGIPVCADPAFRLTNAQLPTAALAAAGIGSTDDVVPVVLRNWAFEGDSAKWQRAIADVLAEFAGQHRVRLLFIPFQASADVEGDMSNDPALIQRVRTWIGSGTASELPHGLAPREISALIGRCPMAIVMRLHGAILSVRNATPFVALGYDPKVENVLSECGLRQFVAPMPTGEAETRALSRLLEETWSARASIRKLLAKTAASQASNAAGHVEHLAAAVQGAQKKRLDLSATKFLAVVAGEQLRRLAQAEEAARRGEAAEATLRSAIGELIEADCRDAALRVMESWLPKEDAAKAEREYRIAFCLHGLGRDPYAALEHYTAALQLGFDEFWGLYHRGQLLFSLGERDRALADLRRAVELQPEHRDAARILADWSGVSRA